MMRGKGMVSPLNTPQLLEQSKLNADHSKCRGLREEAEWRAGHRLPGGDENAGTSEYLVAKRSGLPLKEEPGLGAGGHLAVHVEEGIQPTPAAVNSITQS